MIKIEYNPNSMEFCFGFITAFINEKRYTVKIKDENKKWEIESIGSLDIPKKKLDRKTRRKLLQEIKRVIPISKF